MKSVTGMAYLEGMQDEFKTAIDNLTSAGIAGEIAYSGSASGCPCRLLHRAA